MGYVSSARGARCRDSAARFGKYRQTTAALTRGARRQIWDKTAATANRRDGGSAGPATVGSLAALRLAVAAAPMALTLVALHGCAGAPPPSPPDPTTAPAVPAAEFPGADRLLQGFSAPDGDPAWRAGDTVLLALRLQDHAEVRRWLLRLRVLHAQANDAQGQPLPLENWSIDVDGTPQQFAAALARIDATVADADGKILGISTLDVPRDFLDKGFGAACTQVEALGMLSTGSGTLVSGTFHLQPLVEAMVSVVALFGIVLQNDTLAPILWEVVDKPSVFSVLWHGGAKATLTPRFQETVRAATTPPQLPPGDPAWVVPLTLLVNDAPALYCDLLVGSSAPPLHLTGGIVGGDAQRPGDPDLRFQFAVLAAYRAHPPAPTRGRAR